MEWSEETIQRLRVFWEEGLSTAEIGRRLGMSKNAVVGKAHRLDLPARPSPIRRGGSGTPRPKRPSVRRPPVAGPTLPPLACLGEGETAALRRRQTISRTPAPSLSQGSGPVPAARVVTPAPRVQPAVPRPYGRVITCCWPIGEPGTPSFRFCDEPSVPGKPYCEEHAELAYVRVREKHEDAA
jgi:GcrA cell cycle regulator